MNLGDKEGERMNEKQIIEKWIEFFRVGSQEHDLPTAVRLMANGLADDIKKLCSEAHQKEIEALKNEINALEIMNEIKDKVETKAVDDLVSMTESIEKLINDFRPYIIDDGSDYEACNSSRLHYLIEELKKLRQTLK